MVKYIYIFSHFEYLKAEYLVPNQVLQTKYSNQVPNKVLSLSEYLTLSTHLNILQVLSKYTVRYLTKYLAN